jgi:hypothetical protein
MLILPSYAPLQAEFVDAMRNMASAKISPVNCVYGASIARRRFFGFYGVKKCKKNSTPTLKKKTICK